ncbi:hypothetical protein MtrunA17_Chr2g0316671 [Medicago truncatula]|uniref:Transmembrane protein n=1 Tax=Medicago truncatula TaxID=3880 RepID=A0A396JD73_MEDTR|nr:uncharacterized protein LOC120578087 [Medicago truncatula]RHN75024.1 hypothetical protein MtrunA17_Chr2g0316671 [Medicago truncatula]
MPLLCAYRGMNSFLKQNATATAPPSVSSRFLSYMFNKFFEYFSQIMMALVLCLITFFKNLILAFLRNLLQWLRNLFQWLRNLFQPSDNDSREDDLEDPTSDDDTIVPGEGIEEIPNPTIPRTQDSDGVQGPTELPTETTQGTQPAEGIGGTASEIETSLIDAQATQLPQGTTQGTQATQGIGGTASETTTSPIDAQATQLAQGTTQGTQPTEGIGGTLSETAISPIDAQATQLLEQEGGNTVVNVVDFSDLEEIIFSLVEEILSFTIYGLWYGLLKVIFKW